VSSGKHTNHYTTEATFVGVTLLFSCDRPIGRREGETVEETDEGRQHLNDSQGTGNEPDSRGSWYGPVAGSGGHVHTFSGHTECRDFLE
jgi:hypothetical protein